MNTTLAGSSIYVAGAGYGVITGITYGLLAVGLVLAFRASRVVNFAHAQMGAFAAAVMELLAVRYHVPYVIAFALALLIGALIGGVTEATVVRRLRNTPKLMTAVATLGLGQFLLLLALAVNSSAQSSLLFPQPTFLPQFNIGALFVNHAYMGILTMGPVIVLGITIFLRRSKYGIAIRVAASNPNAARLAGIRAARMASLSWAIAGALSAFTAILIIPSRTVVGGGDLGTSLLVRGLAAAVIARMESLPIALLSGVALGVLESEVALAAPNQGNLAEPVLLAVILTALLFQRNRGSRDEDAGSWSAIRSWPPVAPSLMRSALGRSSRRGALAFALAVAATIPLWATNATSFRLTLLVAYAVVGLSIGIITGLGGQLSFGQFALAAVGAIVSVHVTASTGNFAMAFVLAGLAGAAVSIVIAIPALRVRGLLLAVTTLSFAVATQSWLLKQPFGFGSGAQAGRPIIAGHVLATSRQYFYVALVVGVAALWLARNIWSSAYGRKLRALRDNERQARAFTIGGFRTPLQAFALAGFIAGVGGAVYAHAFETLTSEAFPADYGVQLVAMTVIGGLALLAGPLLGALYIFGIPIFFHLDAAGLATTSFGWLLLLLYLPGGLADVLRPIRDRFWRLVERFGPGDDRSVAPSTVEIPERSLGAPTTQPLTSSPPLPLSVAGLQKAYGGVTAVDNVSFAIEAGSTVGLIGPNGAGKTTIFEIIAGFVRAEGTVSLGGVDLSRLSVEERARAGVIRSFQDSPLFPTLTVLESVTVAHERVLPARLAVSLLGLRRGDARRVESARAIIASLGLERYADTPTGDLSTGTRRICELACLIALRPRILLLDEPSSGIAQRETEALGKLLKRIKDEYQFTLIVIEHDMPLIRSLADRLIALDAGSVIADGAPTAVLNDARVLESYLGSDQRAIDRSGATGYASKECGRRTRNGDRCRRRTDGGAACAQHRAAALAVAEPTTEAHAL